MEVGSDTLLCSTRSRSSLRVFAPGATPRAFRASAPIAASSKSCYLFRKPIGCPRISTHLVLGSLRDRNFNKTFNLGFTLGIDTSGNCRLNGFGCPVHHNQRRSFSGIFYPRLQVGWEL